MDLSVGLAQSMNSERLLKDTGQYLPILRWDLSSVVYELHHPRTTDTGSGLIWPDGGGEVINEDPSKADVHMVPISYMNRALQT